MGITIGDKFGRWTAIKQVSTGRRSRWKCECECGTIKTIRYDALTNYGSQSCGCLQREITSLRHRIHGTPREYRIWQSMRQRCHNPKASNFHLYGARGVQVCERWSIYQNFIDDMGIAPSGDHSIDRYPNKDGNYEPSNCRWATIKEQIRNRRSTVSLTINGVTLSAAEWHERHPVVPYSTLVGRLRRGWNHETALLKPSATRRR